MIGFCEIVNEGGVSMCRKCGCGVSLKDTSGVTVYIDMKEFNYCPSCGRKIIHSKEKRDDAGADDAR